MLLPSSFDSHCEYTLDDFETVFDLDNHVIPTPQQTADLSNAYSVQYLDQSTTSSLLSTSNTTISNAWAQVSDQPQGSQNTSSQNSQQSTSGDFPHQPDRSQVWQNYQPSQDVSSNSKRPDTLPSNFKYYNIGDTVTTGTGFVPLSTSHRRSDSSVTDQGEDVVSSNSYQDNTNHASAAYSFDDSIPAHQNYLHYQQAHQKGRLRKEINIDGQQNRSSDRTSNQNQASESSGVQYIRQTGPFYTTSSLWQRVQQEFTTLTTSFFAHTKQNDHTNNNSNNREVRIRGDHKNTNASTQTDSSSSTLPLPNATMNTFKNIDIGGYVGNFQSGSGLFTDILNGNMSSIPGMSLHCNSSTGYLLPFDLLTHHSSPLISSFICSLSFQLFLPQPPSHAPRPLNIQRHSVIRHFEHGKRSNVRHFLLNRPTCSTRCQFTTHSTTTKA
jgi:hypothetical protein